MSITLRPHYTLSSDYKWLTKFRGNKKVLQNLRSRAIRLFEYSILEDNIYNDRVQHISVKACEMYWAAKYPYCVETPNIRVYNLSIRGRLGIRAKNIGAITRLSEDKFDIPVYKFKPNEIMWFDKLVIEGAFK